MNSGNIAADESERAAFREAVSQFLAKEASSDRVRAVVAAEGQPDPELARQAARMGWFGLELPEGLGGAGAGFSDLVLLLEEAGTRAASAPLLSSSVLCAGSILLGGSREQQERWLPGLANGSLLGTALLPDRVTAAGLAAGAVEVSRAGSGARLTGHCAYVLDARVSDLLVVIAREAIRDDADQASARQVVCVVAASDPGVQVEPLAMTDGTRCLDAVRLDGVPVDEANVLAYGHAADRLVAALANRAAVALAADSAGIARRVLDMTVSYASVRTQFGRPIGSFQAVKHQAADMLVDTETSRELVGYAADQVAARPGGAESAVAASMAKSYACEKAALSVGTAVQLHGGIGYTWEHDLHLFLKRAKLNEQLFGAIRWHRERIAAGMVDDQVA